MPECAACFRWPGHDSQVMGHAYGGACLSLLGSLPGWCEILGVVTESLNSVALGAFWNSVDSSLVVTHFSAIRLQL